MDKAEFLAGLTEKLSFLPWEEIDDRWEYLSEMIDDRMDEGLTEEEAVAELGPVEDVAVQIVEDLPLSILVKGKVKAKRRLGPWEITLLILGAPLWLPLLISAFAVAVSLYAALWSAIVSFWAVFVSLAVCAPVFVIGSIPFAVTVGLPVGLALLGAGIFCAGLAVFCFFGCKAATVGTARLTKKMLLGLKRSFVGKEYAA